MTFDQKAHLMLVLLAALFTFAGFCMLDYLLYDIGSPRVAVLWGFIGGLSLASFVGLAVFRASRLIMEEQRELLRQKACREG